jgi:hypothetical protein
MRQKRGLVTLLLIALFVPSGAFAQQSSSTNYNVNEAFFGTGGEVDLNSTNFSAQGSAGALGVGNTSSPNYDAEAGFLTQNSAYLEMSVENATVDLGTLETGSSSSGAAQGGACNCSFSVRTYISSQYVIYTISDPPTNESGDVLTAKGTQAAPSSDPDIEEFGINVVDNTNPNIGADPFNYPDSTFADGEAAPGYEVADQFKYVAGEIIARSQATPGETATGRTDYTVSYTAKRNAITPAGVYVMSHVLVVVPTY